MNPSLEPLADVYVDGQLILVNLIGTPAAEGPSDIALDRKRIDQALEVVGKAAEQLLGALRQLAPTEVSLEFGVGFGVSEGKLLAALVDASATSSFKVSMKWCNPAA